MSDELSRRIVVELRRLDDVESMTDDERGAESAAGARHHTQIDQTYNNIV